MSVLLIAWVLTVVCCSCLADALPARAEYTRHHQYSTWMLDSIISRQEGVEAADGLLGGIQKGIFQEALRAAISQSKNDTQRASWSEYHRQSVMYKLHDFFDPVADSLAPLDRLCAGVSILHMNSDDKSARAAVEALRRSLDLQNTNANGGWWYFTDPPPPYETYGNLSYSDGMYGVAPFAVLYSQRYPSDAGVNISTAVRQLEAIYTHARHPSKLIVHGYDGSKSAPWADPETGASPVVWGRSMAWYMIGTLNALEIAAQDSSTLHSHEYGQMSTIFRELAHANVGALWRSAQKTSRYGVWQVVDRPGEPGNFVEASASAMMAYVLAKGIRLGHIDPLYQPDELIHDHKDTMQRPMQTEHQGTPSSARSIVQNLYGEVARSFIRRSGGGLLEFHGTSAISSLHVEGPYYEYYTHRPTTDDSLIGESAFVLASLENEYVDAKLVA